MSRGRRRKEYRNPPIEEAIYQLTFDNPQPWTVATPGLLYDALQSKYPMDPEEQQQLAASMDAPTDAASASFQVKSGGTRILYRDETGTRLVVASRSTLSANCQRPYEGWPSLRQRLEEAVKSSQRVLGQPLIREVSLRYINRILIPGPSINTDHFFKIKIYTVGRGKAALGGFIHRVESILDQDNIRAASTFASLESDVPDTGAFLLDLEFKKTFETPVTIEVAQEFADRLKTLENREFEACLTPKLKEMFNE